MRSVSLFLMLCGFYLSSAAQLYEHPTPIYLKLGYSSEIRLPQSYLQISIPAPVYQVKEVEGFNRQVLLLTPLTPKFGETNLRIYTENYAFNLRIILNKPGRVGTKSLDLSRNVQPYENIDFTEVKPDKKSFGKNYSKDLQYWSKVLLEKTGQKFSEPNPHAHAVQLSRIVLGVDNIFYSNNKTVFKLSIYNHSNVPYRIDEIAISYREYRKKFLFLKRNMVNEQFLEILSQEFHPSQTVLAKGVTRIILVSDKIGTKDGAYFRITVREDSGNRDISFEVPSDID